MSVLNSESKVLVIGQGLAGTLIAHQLRSHNIDHHVIGYTQKNSSSMVAAGLINPITGRNYTLSYKIPELIAAAKEEYGAIEQVLNCRVLHDQRITRTLTNIGNENQWLAKANRKDHAEYMGPLKDGSLYDPKTEAVHMYAEVLNGLRLDVKLLVTKYKEYLQKESRYTEVASVDPYTRLDEEKYSHHIFCEGWRVILNPLFSYLPFEPAKGEVLIIKCSELKLNTALKNGVFIIPIGGDQYWVGSTYDWKTKDESPTVKKREYLIKVLDKVLKVPYTIVKHEAAIRPCVKDRKPIIGRHPLRTNCILFNGLGTKGASLAPYFSRQLVQHLITEAVIEKPVCIDRFKK